MSECWGPLRPAREVAGQLPWGRCQLEEAELLPPHTHPPPPAQARLGLCVQGSEAAAAEARGLYARLMQLDPLRAGYYKDALEGKAFVVVSALGTV